MTKLNTLRIPLLLWIVLTSTYWLFYIANPASTDELSLINAAQSLVQRGDLKATTTYDFGSIERNVDTPPPQLQGREMTAVSPWQVTPFEPMQPVLTAPLVWLAQHIPSIGLVHLLWFFNSGITTLTALLLYYLGRELGFDEPIAALGALCFGLGSMALVYTKFFFREPLAGLFFLWAVYMAILIRRQWQASEIVRQRVLGFGLGLGLAILGMLLTKVVMVLTLPALVILLIPSLANLKAHFKKISVAILAIIVLVIVLFIVINQFDFLAKRFSLKQLKNNTLDLAAIWDSLWGYQISPGRSFWLFSPILILAWPGFVLLFKQNRQRIVLAILFLLIEFPLFYGFKRKGIWWGGTGWGPRFLLPLVPLACVATLPVLELAYGKERRKGWTIFASLIIPLSIAFQFLGALVEGKLYYDLVFIENIPADKEGLWTWQWSQPGTLLRLFDSDQLYTAWGQVSSWLWLGDMAIGLLALGLLSYLLWRTREHAFIERLANPVLLGLLVLNLGLLPISLYALRDDINFAGQYPDMVKLIDELNEQAQPEDIIFVTNTEYRILFMDRLKAGNFQVVLPYPPGEITNVDVAPQVISDDPAVQLGPYGEWALAWTAKHYPRLWIVIDSGPFIYHSLRPAERYMVNNHYPVKEISISQYARAILFETSPTPADQPTIASGFVWEDALELVGYDLPKGNIFRAGEILPVSLVWTPLKSLTTDYNISVQLARADGVLVSQRDGAFQGGFGYTSRWQVDVAQRDNHGLEIPTDLAPGEYTLQVVIYTWQDGQRLLITDADGQAVGDIGRLTTITIQ